MSFSLRPNVFIRPTWQVANEVQTRFNDEAWERGRVVQPSGSDATCLLALVRSLARVLTNVVRQMVLARKRLGAVLTAVRRFSRVRADVNHQVLLPGERLAAPRLPSVQRRAWLTLTLAHIFKSPRQSTR